MTDVLDQQEKETLQTAAYGAVMLVSVAYPRVVATARTNIVGAKVLSSATGLVGEVLSAKLEAKLPKGTNAEVADVILPALRDAVAILERRAPAEVENYRRTVRLAVERGVGSEPEPVVADMVAKVEGALAGS